MGTTDGTDSPDLAISSADAPDFVLCGLPFWLSGSFASGHLDIVRSKLSKVCDPASLLKVTKLWPATARKALQR